MVGVMRETHVLHEMWSDIDQNMSDKHHARLIAFCMRNFEDDECLGKLLGAQINKVRDHEELMTENKSRRADELCEEPTFHLDIHSHAHTLLHHELLVFSASFSMPF